MRQLVLFKIWYPIARRSGIRKGDKLARFGEQGYAILYFSFFGAWGLRIMSHLPTWWYNCPQFWIGTFVVSRCSNFKLTVILDYPHWQMTPELKRYYLMQASYWCQQLIVLVFRLEKPRKDYKEYVAHHIVTLWLIGLVSGLCTLAFVYSHCCSQVELRHQPHAHRECCIYLNGCPRLFPRNR